MGGRGECSRGACDHSEGAGEEEGAGANEACGAEAGPCCEALALVWRQQKH
jgi:hypothetical protein